jgi:resuscitation-promoting factor RpfB
MSKPKKKNGGMGIFVAVAAGLAIAGAHDTHHAKDPKTPAADLASASSTVALGKQMAAQYGWTGQQWYCLDALWTRESGWRMVWNYQGSGAYGIPQALPPSKMASAGADYMTDPRTQIRWGLGYVADDYGTPCAAWRHEEEHSWY